MSENEKLQRLVKQSISRYEEMRNQEKLEDESKIKKAKTLAASDLKNWKYAIEVHLTNKVPGRSLTGSTHHISFMWQGSLWGWWERNIKVPGLATVLGMRSSDAETAYVNELCTLLGDPFKVELQDYGGEDSPPYRGYIESESGEVSHIYGPGGGWGFRRPYVLVQW